MRIIIYIALYIPFLISGCAKPVTTPPVNNPPVSTTIFENHTDEGIINSPAINEASGIVASRTNANKLWTHNDSGDKNRIFLIDNHGQLKGTYYLNGTHNRDWEDIEISDIGGQHYLWVADIGDNSAVHGTSYVYRIVEPAYTGHANDTVLHVETIAIQYPDMPTNAEALLVDQQTNDMYIVTKGTSAKVYKVAYPQSTTSTNNAVLLGTLPFTLITAGDISPNNQEILLKNYNEVYYWKRKSGASIFNTIQDTVTKLPYTAEPQGEGIGFANDSSGYYTISELSSASNVHLYFYKRL
jgi:hypothetical protein